MSAVLKEGGGPPSLQLKMKWIETVVHRYCNTKLPSSWLRSEIGMSESEQGGSFRKGLLQNSVRNFHP